MGYSHRYWMCPFFEWDAKDSIHCTGGSKVILETKAAFQFHAGTFCANRSGWRSCSIARSLQLDVEEVEKLDDMERDDWRKQIADRDREIKRLQKSEAEILRRIDMILINACRSIGTKTEDGGFVLRLHDYQTSKEPPTKEFFTISAETDENGDMVLRANRREPK